MKSFINRMLSSFVIEGITEEEVTRLTKIYLKNTRLQLFYAWLTGFRRESILSSESMYDEQSQLEELNDFCERLLKEPDDITADSEWETFQKLFKDLDGTFTKRFWDDRSRAYYSSIVSEEDLHFMDQMVRKWPTKGIYSEVQPFFDTYRDDILDYVYEMRSSDTLAICSKAEEKWEYLSRLLRKALRNGINEYGEQTYDLFFDECEKFGKHYFSNSELNFYDDWAQHCVSKIIYYYSLAILENTSNSDESIIPDDGLEFEYWCADKFNAYGWEAVVTKGSGDQGVDVVASYKSITFAVQCKRYSGSVGNKAVQEVFAGKANIDADFGCVITTGEYTASAFELASATNVFLVHTDDLDDFLLRITRKLDS